MVELTCDICGGGPVRAQVLIEGAKMLACSRCMRGGKVLHVFEFDEAGAEVPLGRNAPRGTMEATEEVIEDFGRVVRSQREKLKLPLDVVAERIQEKESFIHAIENGRLAPTLEVARKLEKELGVRLVVKAEASVSATASPKTGFAPPTLADMLAPSKKKKEK